MEVMYDGTLNHTMVFTDADILYVVWWPRPGRDPYARVYEAEHDGRLNKDTVEEHALWRI